MSDHFRAMADANAESVLGDFNSQKLSTHGVEHKFYQRDGQYYIATINEDGEQQEFKILHTFGHYPLQQYVVDKGKGHLQALNLAWDSRSHDEGGQRWFHLQANEDITPDHAFFWQGDFQNLNGRCAECHTTDYKKNYDSVNHSYDTAWSEINVACEACHGPGSEHVKIIDNEKPESRSKDVGQYHTDNSSLTWKFDKGQVNASPSGASSETEINMCGGCHSRRQTVGPSGAGEPYHQSYGLQTLQRGLYHADGQIQDEVFVLGSFLQSKMSQKGVTCSNCHNPHSGKLVAEPNQVCAQCHAPIHYETDAHSLHSDNTVQCIDCHMPQTTYMTVDDRRDHRFNIPNPTLARQKDLPLACDSCHQDKERSWAESVFKKLGVKVKPDHWVEAKHAGDQLDPLAVTDLQKLANDKSLPAIIRASLLETLTGLPNEKTLDIAHAALRDDDPLVRIGGVRSLSAVEPAMRWQILQNYVDDSSRAVRFALAQTLAGAHGALNQEDQLILSKLLNEYRASLSATLDTPNTQLALAELELALGSFGLAEQHYQKSLETRPSFVAGMLNYSQFLRQRGNTTKESQLLKRAIDAAPESSAAQQALGLYHVRQKQYQQALPYLKNSSDPQAQDASPRYAYVYAVALDSLDKTTEAIDVLLKADHQWPRQYDILIALVLYLEKQGRLTELREKVLELNSFASQRQQVRFLTQKFLQN